MITVCRAVSDPMCVRFFSMLVRLCELLRCGRLEKSKAAVGLLCASTLATYFPMFVLCLRPTLFTQASELEFSGGFLNTPTYVLQSRCAAKLTGGPSATRQQRDTNRGGPTNSIESLKMGTLPLRLSRGTCSKSRHQCTQIFSDLQSR